MAGQFLTKSRFNVGFECPTKLHFLDNSAFGNSNSENAFLEALAEGGFQVGELAKLYFPGGTEVKTLKKEDALAQTAELLRRDSVVIYEAALQFENLFVRTDILVKSGDKIHVIEVKAKSYDPTEENQFYTKTSLKKGPRKLNSTWEPYIVDLAFQCHVARLALSARNVSGSLLLADKTATTTVDGLNQKFVLTKDSSGRVSAQVAKELKPEHLGKKILVQVPADDEIQLVFESNYECGGTVLPFLELVRFLSETCKEQTFVKPVVGSHCKSCEFRISDDVKGKSFLSGFEKCWVAAMKLKHEDFIRPFVFDIWNFRKAGALIDAGKLFMDQLSEEDINPVSNSEPGLSNSERQWLQVEKVIRRDSEPYIDTAGLASEFKQWKYPLHFIDFETTMVAIPFNTGRRPYEQIAFQFSHHRVEKNGVIAHVDEYINRSKGAFPNFDFVRALKRSLETDGGTIFRYATHENTVLCQIKAQLADSKEKDRKELIEFIESITSYENAAGKLVEGKRCMVDLCELVKKYFYDPRMKGSNSIKKVLPAILNCSKFLQEKYSKPLYGSANGVASKNFESWTWISKDASGLVIDPYKRLPPIFTDLDLEEMDSLILDGSIADGGAAMTAYSRMQFTEMSDEESDRVAKALLKYCELDTFAMVLIWEYWDQQIRSSKKKAA